jgi:hypothetical protein
MLTLSWGWYSKNKINKILACKAAQMDVRDDLMMRLDLGFIDFY